MQIVGFWCSRGELGLCKLYSMPLHMLNAALYDVVFALLGWAAEVEGTDLGGFQIKDPSKPKHTQTNPGLGCMEYSAIKPIVNQALIGFKWAQT